MIEPRQALQIIDQALGGIHSTREQHRAWLQCTESIGRLLEEQLAAQQATRNRGNLNNGDNKTEESKKEERTQ